MSSMIHGDILLETTRCQLGVAASSGFLLGRAGPQVRSVHVIMIGDFADSSDLTDPEFRCVHGGVSASARLPVCVCQGRP